MGSGNRVRRSRSVDAAIREAARIVYLRRLPPLVDRGSGRDRAHTFQSPKDHRQGERTGVRFARRPSESECSAVLRSTGDHSEGFPLRGSSGESGSAIRQDRSRFLGQDLRHAHCGAGRQETPDRGRLQSSGRHGSAAHQFRAVQPRIDPSSHRGYEHGRRFR